MDNILDALKQEIKRCEELEEAYLSVPQGKFAVIMIREEMDKAKNAIIENDTVKMIECYQELKQCN